MHVSLEDEMVEVICETRSYHLVKLTAEQVSGGVLDAMDAWQLATDENMVDSEGPLWHVPNAMSAGSYRVDFDLIERTSSEDDPDRRFMVKLSAGDQGEERLIHGSSRTEVLAAALAAVNASGD